MSWLDFLNRPKIENVTPILGSELADSSERVPPRDLFYTDSIPLGSQLLGKHQYENYQKVSQKPNRNSQNSARKMNQIDQRILDFEEFQKRDFFSEGYEHGGRSMSFEPLNNGLQALYGRAKQLLELIISQCEANAAQFKYVMEFDKENHLTQLLLLDSEKTKRENEELLKGLNSKTSGLHHQILQYEDGFKQGFSNKLTQQVNS